MKLKHLPIIYCGSLPSVCLKLVQLLFIYTISPASYLLYVSAHQTVVSTWLHLGFQSCQVMDRNYFEFQNFLSMLAKVWWHSISGPIPNILLSYVTTLFTSPFHEESERAATGTNFSAKRWVQSNAARKNAGGLFLRFYETVEHLARFDIKLEIDIHLEHIRVNQEISAKCSCWPNCIIRSSVRAQRPIISTAAGRLCNLCCK